MLTKHNQQSKGGTSVTFNTCISLKLQGDSLEPVNSSSLYLITIGASLTLSTIQYNTLQPFSEQLRRLTVTLFILLSVQVTKQKSKLACNLKMLSLSVVILVSWHGSLDIITSLIRNIGFAYEHFPRNYPR